jgi:hypothetical protein
MWCYVSIIPAVGRWKPKDLDFVASLEVGERGEKGNRKGGREGQRKERREGGKDKGRGREERGEKMGTYENRKYLE